MADRYDTLGNPEGRFQPGSNDRVLINKLGIIEPTEMDEIELNLMGQLTEVVLGEVEADQVISSNDLCEWHRRWLGNVYVWAGQYRSVNMGKGDFQFAAAHLIDGLMQRLDKNFFTIYTPCNRMSEGELAEALAIIHIETILIHPFRDGNGRLSRLVSNIMALQADYPMLDFSYMDNKREAYFSAIQAGLDDSEPLQKIFRQVLLDSLKNAGD
jgi:cell filamentation protein